MSKDPTNRPAPSTLPRRLLGILLAFTVALSGCANPAAAPVAGPPPPPVVREYVIADDVASSEVRCADTHLGSMWWMRSGEAVALEYSPDHCPGGEADMEQRR